MKSIEGEEKLNSLIFGSKFVWGVADVDNDVNVDNDDDDVVDVDVTDDGVGLSFGHRWDLGPRSCRWPMIQTRCPRVSG